ncbi:integrase catalytic domain-containing protein [Trichonephila clavipes]|nr:integrase catalytic domain-containing protein [Trichonephila clavipes]
MYKDTKNFVRSCTICLSRKNVFKIPPAPHQPVEQSQEPGETCHIDIFGPLKSTPKGSEFLEFCRVMGIRKRHISNYSAHVNGRVEKPNQSLANILASITLNTNDWDEQLPYTMLVLNSVIHEATYTSPFFLEHGRDILLSYIYQKSSDTPQKKYEYVEKLLPSLEQIFLKVLQNLKEQEAFHINLSTRTTKPHHYDKIGSLCFIKTPNIKSNLSPKLRPKFEGPYRVVERFSNVNYRVQHVEQLRKRFNTHVNRMIPFINRFSYLLLNNLDNSLPDNHLVALHFKYDQARRRFVEWAQNEIAVVPDFHKQILFSNEVHFWLNGYVNKQNCRIWSEANPQVYVETPLHPEKLTVWCALWAGGILLQKR